MESIWITFDIRIWNQFGMEVMWIFHQTEDYPYSQWKSGRLFSPSVVCCSCFELTTRLMPPASSVGDDHAALQQAPIDTLIGFQDPYHSILVSTTLLGWEMGHEIAIYNQQSVPILGFKRRLWNKRYLMQLRLTVYSYRLYMLLYCFVWMGQGSGYINPICNRGGH